MSSPCIFSGQAGILVASATVPVSARRPGMTAKPKEDRPVRSPSEMPRQARLQFVSLKSSLVNLPVSLFGPLLERNIASLSVSPSPPHTNQAVFFQRPQQLAVLLSATAPSPESDGKKPSAYVGWTGMVSASSLAHFNPSSSDHTLETVEIDPQYAESLGFKKGDVVRNAFPHSLCCSHPQGRGRPALRLAHSQIGRHGTTHPR